MDGKRRAELVEHREGEGVSWIAERVAELGTKYGGKIAVDSKGPAGSLIPEIKAHGGRVVEYGSAEMAGATARIYDAIADHFLQVRPDPALEIAMEGAIQAGVGRRVVLGPILSKVDISPLVALTLGFDLALVTGRRREPQIWLKFRIRGMTLNPELWGLEHPHKMHDADRMILELHKAHKLEETGPRSELALDLLRVGCMLDLATIRSTEWSGKGRTLLQLAFDAISSDLRGDEHYDWEHDPVIVALLEYIHPPGRSWRRPF